MTAFRAITPYGLYSLGAFAMADHALVDPFRVENHGSGAPFGGAFRHWHESRRAFSSRFLQRFERASTAIAIPIAVKDLEDNRRRLKAVDPLSKSPFGAYLDYQTAVGGLISK